MTKTKTKTKIKKEFNFKRWRMKWFSLHGFMSIGWKIVRAIILIGCCYTIIYPFLLKTIDSFKSFEDYLDPAVQYIPKYFTWNNIRVVLGQLNFKVSFPLTFFYSVLIAVIQVLICGLAGYGFGRFKFKGSKILFGLVLMELLVPPQTMIIPLFLRFRFFYGGINLTGTYLPIIVMALTGMGIRNGLYIFMFRQTFRNMPKELEEAALIDGCSAFKTFYKVMLPNAFSMMVTVFLISFAWQWTDTTFTQRFQRGTSLLANMITSVDGGEEAVMVLQYNNTAAVLCVLPIMLVYLIGQRFFIQGVERSGITG